MRTMTLLWDGEGLLPSGYGGKKMNICLFSQEEITRPLALNDERAVHLIKILHKKEGDSFHAGIINGQAGTAVITQIESGKSIHFTFTPETDGKPLYPLIMIIGFPRPIQLKRLLRDMAGLGVCQVHLVGTELGEKSYLKADLATTQAGTKMLFPMILMFGVVLVILVVPAFMAL